YGPLTAGQYVATFVVTWNDNANTTTSSTSSTSSSSTSSTSSTSSSSTSSTSSTTSTTTSTTLAPGPGNGPIAPRPEGGLDTGAGVDAAAVRGNERVDVVTSRNATVQETFWNGSAWSAYTDLAKPSVGYKGDPTIVSWAPGRLDVFARGGDDKLWQKTWSGFDWSSWTQPVTDGTLNSSPDAASWDNTNLVVFILGTDQHMYALPFGTGGWGAYVRLSTSAANFTDNPGVT